MLKINIRTNSKEEMIDITEIIQQHISIDTGFVYIYCPHTTAGITINENADPDVKYDILKCLKKMVSDVDFKHIEGNSDAHVKSSLVGKSLLVAIENKKPVLGTWDGIFFCEFDGPRERKIFLKFIEK